MEHKRYLQFQDYVKILELGQGGRGVCHTKCLLGKSCLEHKSGLFVLGVLNTIM